MAFSDLSAALVPAANPYTAPALARPASFVNIRLYSVNTGGQAAGRGSSYYNDLTMGDGDNNPMNDLNPQAMREGVLDGEVWKTINGGFDSWFTTISPHNPGMLPPWQWYHGYVEIDFTNYNFYDGSTLPAPPGMPDLYLVVAHEAMHILGFISHTNPLTGQSIWLPNGSNYYSRFDTHLSPQLLDFILDPNACNSWGSNYSVTADLTDPCNVFFTGPNSLYDVPVYAPASFSPSSLEHLDGTCANGEDYLMHHNNLNPNGQSRIPIQTELNILCDLDFSVTTTYGGSGWDGTSATVVPCGARLAGVDDIYADPPSQTMYKCYQGGGIFIDNFLDNDEDALLGGVPTDHSCLTILTGGGALSSVTANSFIYSPDPAFVGLAVLRYKPRNVGTDREGNLTYIFIPVWPESACDNCNVVKGGDFEGLDLTNVTGTPHNAWRINNPNMNNTPDLLAWNGTNWYTAINGLPGTTFPRNCAFGSSTPVVPSHNGQPINNRYMAMVKYGSDNYREGLLFELCEPLIPGEDYVLSFWAMNTNSTCNNSIEFYSSDTEPCNYMQGVTNAPGLNNCNGNVFTVASLVPNTPLTQSWPLVPYEVSFTYSQPLPGNWLMLVISATGQSNVNGVVFVDDIGIRPDITLSATIDDVCNGQTDGNIILSVSGGYGTYSFSWTFGGNVVGTSQNLTNVGAGSYTVEVTDLTVGCVVTEEFILGVEPCGPPFTLTKSVAPMPTYAYAPVFFTIEACNTTASAESVALTEQFPAGFVMTGSNPSLSWPNVTVNLPAGGCETYVIHGYFTTIGTDQNCVTLDPVGAGDDVQACVQTQILEGCPLVVYGNGGCDPGSVVDMCLGVHTIIPDVSAISYWIIYPNYLVPPTPGALTTPVITSPFAISSATIGVPESLSWPPGYMAVEVTVNFSPLAQVSPPYGFFCIDFTVGPGGVPAGVNTAWTWASAISPNADPLLQHWNHVAITTGGSQAELWTQAYLIQFNGCPGLLMPDASFNIDQVLCTGQVSVSGTLTDPNAVHSWTWGDNRTTPTNGAPSYTYNYFSSITDNQGWPVNPPIGPAAPGTYTITHTVILNGVASISTQQVTIESCCQANTVIPDGSLASAVGSVFSGSVDIQGQFIMDDDVLFQNCQVYMEPGAEIIVQNGWTLDIENSSFTACNDVMWKSITAENGSTVRIRGSFMDDAENTVVALDGSVIWVDGTQFHNNRVTISIPDVGGTYNNVACWVSNSTFYSAGSMPQPYQGQTTAVGSKGFAAVDVHNASLDFTGGNNIIHSLSNGIVGHQSDLSVADCQMLNIQPDAAYAYTGNGAGIYARGGLGFFSLKQQGYGVGGLHSFQDCRWGIYTEYMSVKSTNNRMLDVGTAYRVDRSGYMDVDILNNKVSTHYNGIDLRANDGAAHILVQGNDITFGNDPSCTACRGWYAVYVSEGNYVAPNSRIQNNTIHFLPQYASRYGIGLFAADRWIVAENELSLVNNAFNRTGIWLSGCRTTEVSCNSVNSTDNAYPVDAQAAIRNSMGREPLISCNEMDQTANGILFNGVAYNTDVRGNQFHDHRWPLHLDATAIIDAQTLKGNLWDPNATTPAWGAWYEASNLQAMNYQFLYNPAIIGTGTTVPPSWSPPNWFAYDPGANYDCADHHGEHYCSQFGGERCKDCIRELDEKIASDSLENDPYTDETKWMLATDLYKKLDESPALLDSLPQLDAFYTALQGSAIAAFKAIADDQLALYGLDSAVVAQLQANRNQIETFMALVKDGLEQLGDSTLSPAQRQTILGGISGYRQNINSLTAWNATALQVASASKVLTADGVKAVNLGIATSALIETNEKGVNDIYLATIGKDVDDFTATQTDDLFTIANQCPMVGGNAVFKARSLYWLIDDTYDFDDQLLCLQHGIIVKSLTQQPFNGVAVVPNPASDEATVVLDHELEEPGTFVVYDAVGAEVMRQAIPSEMPRMAFSTASLAPALYHYQVRGPSGIIGVGKLTIVR